MGWGGVFSGSSARNRPTVGSSGVVTTFRTSIVPSCASATRSVKVPPTSTPTLTAAAPHPQPERSKRSEEHTSELQSRFELVCRLLLEKKKNNYNIKFTC